MNNLNLKLTNLIRKKIEIGEDPDDLLVGDLFFSMVVTGSPCPWTLTSPIVWNKQRNRIRAGS